MARKSFVLQSTFKDEIEECLRSGWSPERIVWFLKRMYGTDHPGIPSSRTLYRFREKHIGLGSIVPANLIKKRLQNTTYKIDLLAELAQIAWALSERVASAWQREQDSGSLSAETDRAAQTLLQYLREYKQVAQDLGVMPVRTDQVRLEVESVEKLEIREEDMPDLVDALTLTKRTRNLVYRESRSEPSD